MPLGEAFVSISHRDAEVCGEKGGHIGQAAARQVSSPRPMEIRRLVWDDANREELTAHGVTPAEVEALAAADAWVVDVHPANPEQVRVTGRTPAGRWLTVPLAPTEDAAVWRPVTGWDATPGERAYYWDQ